MQNSLFEQRLENLKTVLETKSQDHMMNNQKNKSFYYGLYQRE